MHILIVRNNSNSQAIDASLLLASYLNSQGISYLMVDSTDLRLHNNVLVFEGDQSPQADLAIALGGDGTILRTARLVSPYTTPILGINFGHLGFLANSSEDGIVAIVAAALADDVVREYRSNLKIDVICDGEESEGFPWIEPDDLEFPEGGCPQKSFFALNELAVTRGTLGRVIDFDVRISGTPLAHMRGDGVIVATSTGSTAYALSAGGPLVAPGFDGLLMVPLAPHTLHSRAVLTAGNDIVEIELTNTHASRESTLFVDGELLQFDSAPAKICVRKGDKPTVLLRYKHEGFYEHASKAFFS